MGFIISISHLSGGSKQANASKIPNASTHSFHFLWWHFWSNTIKKESEAAYRFGKKRGSWLISSVCHGLQERVTYWLFSWKLSPKGFPKGSWRENGVSRDLGTLGKQQMALRHTTKPHQLFRFPLNTLLSFIFRKLAKLTSSLEKQVVLSCEISTVSALT